MSTSVFCWISHQLAGTIHPTRLLRSHVVVVGVCFFVTDARVVLLGASGDTSLSLLARVRGREADAWYRFVHLYSPLVYRWCRQAGLQQADAADVGQEVFRAVAQRIGEFRRD